MSLSFVSKMEDEDDVVIEAFLKPTQDEVQAKEGRVEAVFATFQETFKRRETLLQNIDEISKRCTMKKEQRSKLRELKSEEAKEIPKKIEALREKKCARHSRKLVYATRVFKRTNERIARIQKIAPHIFDDRLMRAELHSVKGHVQRLHRECRQKRLALQNGSRERMKEFQKIIEQTYLLMELGWENGDLEKDDETAVTIITDCNAKMIRSNQALRRKLQNRPRFRLIRF